MFNKTNRLAKTLAVKTALYAGRGFFNPNFNLRVIFKTGAPRFTVVVSTKVDKHAVKRNRLKRIIREFVRLRLNSFKPGDYIIMLKPSAAKMEEKVLLKKFEEALLKWRLIE